MLNTTRRCLNIGTIKEQSITVQVQQIGKKMISHNVLGYNPFTVEFINSSTGTTVIQTYNVALTKKEIEAEYDYVSFPCNKS